MFKFIWTYINDIRNNTEPPAWIRKYFIIASVVKDVIEKSGRKPNIEISKPIHIKNQLLLLIIILMESIITIR